MKTDFRNDQLELSRHNERMDRGCLVCRSAVTGRVCPDCYVCVSCLPGCDVCAGVRRRRTSDYPSYPSTRTIRLPKRKP